MQIMPVLNPVGDQLVNELTRWRSNLDGINDADLPSIS